MNFLSDRIRHLFESKTKRAPELSTATVRHDKLDEGVYEDLMDRALGFKHEASNAPTVDLDALDPDGKLTKEQRAKLQSYFAWPDLHKDIFYALHTYRDPELLAPEQVKGSRELNRRTVQGMVGTDRFEELRLDTRHDDLGAMCVSMTMGAKVRESFEENLQEWIRRTIEMNEIEQEMENLPPDPDGEPGEGEPGEGEPGPGGTPVPGEPGPDAEPSERDKLAQQLAELEAEAEAAGTGAALQQAVEEAVDEGSDMAEAIASMPGSGGGDEKRLDPDKFIELAETYKNNPVLQRVAEMTGRMERHMSSARARRIVGGREEIVDVETGNDLSLTLPAQFALAGHPQARVEFARRYNERSLLQYETVGTEDAGMGPLCISVDGSSSMSGTRNEWARALSLALITIARRERRDAMVVEFDGANTKVWEFLHREPMDPEKVVEFATHFFCGGTDNTLGIRMCKKFIDTRPEFEKADIVVLTDGEDRYQAEDVALREEFTQRGIRVHGVSIGHSAEANTYLKELADTLVTATDMLQPSAATEQLAQNIT